VNAFLAICTEVNQINQINREITHHPVKIEADTRVVNSTQTVLYSMEHYDE